MAQRPARTTGSEAPSMIDESKVERDQSSGSLASDKQVR